MNNKKELEKLIEIIEDSLGEKKEKIELLNNLQNLNKAVEGLTNPQLNDYEYNKAEEIALEEEWIYKELENYEDIKITSKDINRYNSLIELKIRLFELKGKELENKKEMNELFGEESIKHYSN